MQARCSGYAWVMIAQCLATPAIVCQVAGGWMTEFCTGICRMLFNSFICKCCIPTSAYSYLCGALVARSDLLSPL
ncbi:hypothetical protein B0H21DRAFT_772516 [Amylocystis lapponica]|nr:hypothetical protein B0H21DRAFT_772516 [Amylocystis lapponica]